MTANCTAFCSSPRRSRSTEARAAERELMAGMRRGPLHGIPYALKDIIETAGIRTTGHSKLRQDHVPAADAEIVTRLKSGGGVLLGKLATWEFALGGPSWDLPWPPALNPWDTDGCRAARRAAPGRRWRPGSCPARSAPIPAARCAARRRCAVSPGSSRPTARVSRRGVFPNTFSMDHCGPLTRSAEDIALFSRSSPATTRTTPAARMSRCRTTRPR